MFYDSNNEWILNALVIIKSKSNSKREICQSGHTKRNRKHTHHGLNYFIWTMEIEEVKVQDIYIVIKLMLSESFLIQPHVGVVNL